MEGSGVEDRSRLDGFELEIFKLAREHATSEQWREWLRAPLEHAAADGNMELFTRLMDAGADGGAGWRGCRGRTLLGAAVYGKREKIVQALLQAGAKPDLDVKFGAKSGSALHVAAMQGAGKIYNMLMLAGADPNVRNVYKETPLHLAAEAGHHEVVGNLLLKGALPNAKTRGAKQTPLHLAASKGHAFCVSNLLVGGARKDSTTSAGETPLHLAAQYNHLEAVEELLVAGADVYCRGGYTSCSPLDMAACRGHLDVVRKLIQHGSSAKASSYKGFTALHCAADGGAAHGDRGDIIRVLLEAEADIEAKTTQNGLTPLHYAVSRRVASRDTLCALLEGGANLMARSADGYAPLHKACSNSDVGGVELLLRWGTDETLVDQRGKTAEDLVGTWEHSDGTDDEERKADDRRIRHMLARAPADRSWRRRGWLVLARSCPDKVQVAQGGDDGGSSNGSSPKTSKANFGGGGDRRRDETTCLLRLVGRVIELDAEGVFRLVVGFL